MTAPSVCCPEPTLLAEERLQEIKKLLKDAQYGYAVVNNQVYFKDVSLLLADRELWQAASTEMANQIRTLKRDNAQMFQQLQKWQADNADLGLRLDEALRARAAVLEDNPP